MIVTAYCSMSVWFLLNNSSCQGRPNHFCAHMCTHEHPHPHSEQTSTCDPNTDLQHPLKSEARHHLPRSPCHDNHSNPVLPPSALPLAGGASWLHRCCKESEWAQWHSARALLNTALHHITHTSTHACAHTHINAHMHANAPSDDMSWQKFMANICVVPAPEGTTLIKAGTSFQIGLIYKWHLLKMSSLMNTHTRISPQATLRP